jgi:hypothetical protein
MDHSIQISINFNQNTYIINFCCFTWSHPTFTLEKMPVNQTTPQAGVLAGLNPAAYNSADPIVLFVIQVHVQVTGLYFWGAWAVRGYFVEMLCICPCLLIFSNMLRYV